MTAAKFQKEVINKYGDMLSLENIRKFLRISKRKASWMLQNGYIKNKNNGKKTRQYRILAWDLYEYIQLVELNDPSIIIPTGLFNSGQSRKTDKKTLITDYRIHQKPKSGFKNWLIKLWLKEKDCMTVPEISKLIGYNKNTIGRWVIQKRIKSLKIKSKNYIVKDYLIDFLINDAYKIQNKSDKHKKLLIKYYKKK